MPKGQLPLDQLQWRKPYMTVTKSPSAAEIGQMIETLERVLPQLKHYLATCGALEHQNEQQRQQSYVQLAIAVLQELGRPTPITTLLDEIRNRRNDPTITRGSVETSLLRHLNTKGEKTDFVKLAPGTYVHRNCMGH